MEEGMKPFHPVRGLLLGMIAVALLLGVVWWSAMGSAHVETTKRPGPRPHLDHSAFFTKSFSSGPEVTKARLKCHEKEAEDLKKTPHWQWLGDEEQVPGTNKHLRMGKKNLINNF